MPSTLAVWVFVGLAGACIGSFLNVVIVRVPDPALRFLSPARSFCTGCKAPIAARDNVPVLSYLILRGRCRGCRTEISWLYPAVEVGGIAVSLLGLWKFGLTWGAMAAAFFGMVCLVIAACDWREQMIPWRFPLAGAAVLLGWGLVAHGLGTACLLLLDGIAIAALLALIAAVVGWAIGRPFGSENSVMGEADVVVALFLGSALGFGQAAMAISYAALLGLLTFAAFVVPGRYRRTAFLAYVSLFVIGVCLGGHVFLVVQLALLIAAWPARHMSVANVPIPLGTWMCLAAILVVATADPFAGDLQGWLPWHSTEWVPSFLFTSTPDL